MSSKQYLGKYYIPKWLGEILTNDEALEEWDYSDPQGNYIEETYENWIKSISEMCNSLDFSIVGEVSDAIYNPHEVGFLTKKGDAIIEVVVSGTLSLTDEIKASYALEPDTFKERYEAFLSIKDNDSNPQLEGLFSKEMFERFCEDLKDLPEELDILKLMSWWDNSHRIHYQALFTALSFEKVAK